MTETRLTHIGGPTVLVELGGFRLLTDPTFDPAGSEFHGTGSYFLRKTKGPALAPASLGRLDAVLLSHDHHYDNLDAAGRRVLSQASRVLTTRAGAERLGSTAVGLGPWDTVEVAAIESGPHPLRVTATPARHGPAHADRGPVIGFALSLGDEGHRAVYVSGDTVWYDGLMEVGSRFSIGLALLFMGAARVAAVGPYHLTMTAVDGLAFARAFPDATIVPVHAEGWEHFSESRQDIDAAFEAAGLLHRLAWLPPGQPVAFGG